MLCEWVLIKPLPDQEGNKLQGTTSGFIQHSPHEVQYTSQPIALIFPSHSKKKNSEAGPSKQVSAAAVICASDEK